MRYFHVGTWGIFNYGSNSASSHGDETIIIIETGFCQVRDWVYLPIWPSTRRATRDDLNLRKSGNLINARIIRNSSEIHKLVVKYIFRPLQQRRPQKYIYQRSYHSRKNVLHGNYGPPDFAGEKFAIYVVVIYSFNCKLTGANCRILYLHI